MRQFPHTKRNHRSGNWVYFRRIPAQAQATAGRTFFERSLRTADLSRIAEAWASADRDFNSLVRSSTEDSIDALAYHGLYDGVTMEFDARSDFKAWNKDIKATFAPIDLKPEIIQTKVREWSDLERYKRAQRIISDPSYTQCEETFIEECRHVGACGHNRNWLFHSPFLYNLTRKFIVDARIQIPNMHGSLYIIQKMMEDELKRVLEDEGRWRRYDFTDMPTVDPRSRTLSPEGKPFLTLSDMVEKYLSATRKPKKTASKLRLIVRYIEGLTSSDVTVDKITKSNLIELQTIALQCPARTRLYEKQMSLRELASKESIEGTKRKMLTAQAVRSWFNLLGGCYTWAVNAELIATSPVKGIKPKISKLEEGKRASFSRKDIQEIFKPDNFLANASPSRFWIPVIALLTGARLNEIGQLHKSDIALDGIPSFRITDEGSMNGASKRLKNLSSRRIIPIPKLLIDMGFIDFVQTRKTTFLFDDLPHGNEYEPTKAFSQWFGRYLAKTGVKSSDKVFHSFRHTFKDECRRAKIEEEVHDALTGHSNPGRSLGRAYGAGVPIEQLKDAIDLLFTDEISDLLLSIHYKV